MAIWITGRPRRNFNVFNSRFCRRNCRRGREVIIQASNATGPPSWASSSPKPCPYSLPPRQTFRQQKPLRRYNFIAIIPFQEFTHSCNFKGEIQDRSEWRKWDITFDKDSKTKRGPPLAMISTLSLSNSTLVPPPLPLPVVAVAVRSWIQGYNLSLFNCFRSIYCGPNLINEQTGGGGGDL